MLEQLERELAAFTTIMSSPWDQGRSVTRLDEDIYLVEGPGMTVPPGKRYGLTILGLVHGSEVAGAAVLAELAVSLQALRMPLPFPLVLALGNVPAARRGQRFVERDLNRSFGRAGTGGSAEERRAGALEKVLDETAFLLDIHQTMEPSANPFFIFPYHAGGVAFAASVDARVPIVTHWGRAFSQDGRCTDEHVIRQGGVGITIELGKNGFHPYHVGTGFRATWQAVQVAAAHLQGQAPVLTPERLSLYTWADIVPYPAGQVSLREGFTNFMPVHAGQILGDVDGQAIVAKYDGRLLFPKYVRDPRLPRPAELVRIIKPVSFQDLGRSPV